jgi:hypothetical protein
MPDRTNKATLRARVRTPLATAATVATHPGFGCSFALHYRSNLLSNDINALSAIRCACCIRCRHSEGVKGETACNGCPNYFGAITKCNAAATNCNADGIPLPFSLPCLWLLPFKGLSDRWLFAVIVKDERGRPYVPTLLAESHVQASPVFDDISDTVNALCRTAWGSEAELSHAASYTGCLSKRVSWLRREGTHVHLPQSLRLLIKAHAGGKP